MSELCFIVALLQGSALVFQYRDADPDFGSMQAKELSNYLRCELDGHMELILQRTFSRGFHCAYRMYLH